MSPPFPVNDTMEPGPLPTMPQPFPTMQASPDQSDRPQRTRKPNVRLSPEEWELGQVDVAKQFVPTMDWCMDLIKWVARHEMDTKGGGGDK